AVVSVIRFDGFIAAYTDQKEDGEQSDDGDEDGRLPEINAREALAKQKINSTARSPAFSPLLSAVISAVVRSISADAIWLAMP
ncbi:hypothetical protein ACC676_39120, partial [Rhizobium ruizarguesonis]